MRTAPLILRPGGQPIINETVNNDDKRVKINVGLRRFTVVSLLSVYGVFSFCHPGNLHTGLIKIWETMALSDICFDFLSAVNEAAKELAKDVHWYSQPEYPISYGEEIDVLRRACLSFTQSPYDGIKGAHLVRLAAAVLNYHDAPPELKKIETYKSQTEQLTKLLESGSEPIGVVDASYFTNHLISETPFTEHILKRLKIILPTLTYSARKEVIDILNEIGCKLVQNELGIRETDKMNPNKQIDIGIITIKEEEFKAVLDVFNDGSDVFVSPDTHRHYNLRVADAGNNNTYKIAIIRQPEQGNGEAQSAARDCIEDLNPRLILVVGIAGGLPSKDYTLGDVVLSLRIFDYSLEAVQENRDSSYSISGGPVGRQIEYHVANLRARLNDIGNWTEYLPEYPPIVLDEFNFYGSHDWKKDVRESLEYHLTTNEKTPNFIPGMIASSDRLIKDTELLIPWLQTNRHLLAVEMESGGVYRAARERCPMLAIRGISDIIGFKRDERWTNYACSSAAFFAKAYLRTAPVKIVE